jgi:DNA-binding FadR family transcriptional regulator
MNETCSKHKRLIMLIRRLAREEAYEIMDEHLEDYEHKEKPTREHEV